MKNGYFITFEGPDGSGKTTILDLVSKYFSDNDYSFIKTREPGGSKIATQIRDILLSEENKGIYPTSEALLFAASRAQHYEEIIKPALRDNKIVLCDRFIDSSLAYQGYARDLGIDKILEINNFAIDNNFPDVTIFFNLEPRLGLARIAQSGEREINRLDLEGLKFHQKVYDGYKEVIQRYPERFVVINADQSIEDVFNDVINVIKERIHG
jgi:dTMP kinase